MSSTKKTFDEMISGFERTAATLGLTPPAVSLQPIIQTPQPPPIPTAGQAAAAIYSQGTAIPPFNYSGLANTQQSFQFANAFRNFGPDPSYMTPHQFGGFRTLPPPPALFSMGRIPPPAYPMPALPSYSMFSPAGDMALEYTKLQQRMGGVETSSAYLVASRLAATMGGSFIGGSLGAVAGGLLGGSAGARFGAWGGGLAGGAFGGFSNVGQYAANEISGSFIYPRMHMMRVGEIGDRFYRGPDVGAGGYGFNPADTARISQGLSHFADNSKGVFNKRDMVNIMQSAADQGLLDFATHADDVVRMVKTTAKVVAAMAKITGDPDFKQNMQVLGNMQRMGMAPLETLNMLASMRGTTRMSGMSFGGLMAGPGMAGAAMYQGMGLPGAAGALAAMNGMGIAQGAMAAGAVSTNFAGIMGGPSGIAQQLAASQGAFLQGPGRFLLGAFVNGGEGGLKLDTTALQKFARGQLNIPDIIGRASQNLSNPLMQSQYQVQQGEIVGQAATALSPNEQLLLMLRYGKALQTHMGGSKVIGVGGALMANDVDPNTARLLERIGQSRTLMETLQRQSTISEAADKLQRAAADKNIPSLWRSELGRGFSNLGIHSPFAPDWFDKEMAGERANQERLGAVGLESMGSRLLSGSSMGYWSKQRRTGRGRYRKINPALSPGRAVGEWFDSTVDTLGMSDADEAWSRAAGGMEGLLERASPLWHLTGVGSIVDLGDAARLGDTYANGFSPDRVRRMRGQRRASMVRSGNLIEGGLNMTVGDRMGLTDSIADQLGGGASGAGIVGTLTTAGVRFARNQMAASAWSLKDMPMETFASGLTGSIRQAALQAGVAPDVVKNLEASGMLERLAETAVADASRDPSVKKGFEKSLGRVRDAQRESEKRQGGRFSRGIEAQLEEDWVRMTGSNAWGNREIANQRKLGEINKRASETYGDPKGKQIVRAVVYLKAAAGRPNSAVLDYVQAAKAGKYGKETQKVFFEAEVFEGTLDGAEASVLKELSKGITGATEAGFKTEQSNLDTLFEGNEFGMMALADRTQRAGYMRKVGASFGGMDGLSPDEEEATAFERIAKSSKTPANIRQDSAKYAQLLRAGKGGTEEALALSDKLREFMSTELGGELGLRQTSAGALSGKVDSQAYAREQKNITSFMNEFSSDMKAGSADLRQGAREFKGIMDMIITDIPRFKELVQLGLEVERK